MPLPFGSGRRGTSEKPPRLNLLQSYELFFILPNFFLFCNFKSLESAFCGHYRQARQCFMLSSFVTVYETIHMIHHVVFHEHCRHVSQFSESFFQKVLVFLQLAIFWQLIEGEDKPLFWFRKTLRKRSR